jgi:hypothetical protein
MALQKITYLSSGVSGNYIRISAFRWDRTTREASAIFSLYKDQATAQAGGSPLLPVLAKLRLGGAKFDTHLGNVALAGEADMLALIYAAAQVEDCISDFGADVLKGAQVV